MQSAKPILSAFLAALSVAASCACFEISQKQDTRLDTLMAVSQQTVQTVCDEGYLAQDSIGSVMADFCSAAKAEPTQDFISIDGLCDQSIASAKRMAAIRREVQTRRNMYGRLLIPGAGIDVAIITPSSALAVDEYQPIVDAKDSACLLTDRFASGSGPHVIADHSNQDFRNLKRVSVGMPAQIVMKDRTVNLVCSTIINGHNTLTDIVDLNGNNCEGIADYVCYTCQDCWQNVLVVGFNVV